MEYLWIKNYSFVAAQFGLICEQNLVFFKHRLDSLSQYPRQNSSFIPDLQYLRPVAVLLDLCNQLKTCSWPCGKKKVSALWWNIQFEGEKPVIKGA